jgi:hypothetical protein
MFGCCVNFFFDDMWNPPQEETPEEGIFDETHDESFE